MHYMTRVLIASELFLMNILFINQGDEKRITPKFTISFSKNLEISYHCKNMKREENLEFYSSPNIIIARYQIQKC